MNIDAFDVSVRVAEHDILRGETLSCPPGSMTGLVGPSGSGKTTLLHCLGLLQQPTDGKILIDGVDATGWSSGRRRRFWRDETAFVLQDSGVMDEESLDYNVVMSASVIGNRVRGDRTRLREALRETGLLGRGDEPASHLSGGEKQRLAVARAIYKQAMVILVDEPTASLDDRNRATVIGLFEQRAAHGCTVIVATHDPVVMSACGNLHAVGAAVPLASHA